MKKIFLYTALLAACTFMLPSCNDEETYAEQKEKERKAINSFLRRGVAIVDAEGDTICDVGVIKVISESQFAAQDSTTNVDENEYVLFKGSGIYMQIVRKGVGERLKSGDRKRIICQFKEYNILGDSLQIRSDVPFWAPYPDIIDVYCTSGSISGTFNNTINPGGAMSQTYFSSGDKTVFNGWLKPLEFVNIGRQTTAEEGIAKVRVIVPHSEGQSSALVSVYPCFYEITYQEMRD